MNAKKLNQHIFDETNIAYVILDGASIPGLQGKLYETGAQYICLYRGELEPDIAEVAPYLVGLIVDTEFSDWILSEGWGKHWGIFARSYSNLVEMRKHFRSFLTVRDEAGKPMLFRYYDPRVLRNFLPTCKSEELKIFFGIVTNFILEDEDPQNLLNYNLENGELEMTRSDLS